MVIRLLYLLCVFWSRYSDPPSHAEANNLCFNENGFLPNDFAWVEFRTLDILSAVLSLRRSLGTEPWNSWTAALTTVPWKSPDWHYASKYSLRIKASVDCAVQGFDFRSKITLVKLSFNGQQFHIPASVLEVTQYRSFL